MKKGVSGSYSILNPVAGEVVELDEVPDEFFADKALGDGFAHQPIVSKTAKV